MKWQIQDAKARFSEMVERTLTEGAQTVIRRGEPVAVLLSVDEYRRLRSGGDTFKTLLASAPLRDVEIRRSQDRALIFARASRKIRKESMLVNAEFAAIERDPEALVRRSLARIFDQKKKIRTVSRARKKIAR
jgi:prevent-host-death family protein